ncbi:hypothetical protein FGL97_02450 [Pseudomonas putida]|nr:hypothetical protein [Pseudomonas putida]NVN67105.1 hypothetical protein [Pseudomonas putida]
MFTRRSPLPSPPYSRVNPLLHRWGVDTHRWLDTGRRRSGFTREEAGPAGQSPPAVHRCCRHRIRG